MHHNFMLRFGLMICLALFLGCEESAPDAGTGTGGTGAGGTGGSAGTGGVGAMGGTGGAGGTGGVGAMGGTGGTGGTGGSAGAGGGRQGVFESQKMRVRFKGAYAWPGSGAPAGITSRGGLPGIGSF